MYPFIHPSVHPSMYPSIQPAIHLAIQLANQAATNQLATSQLFVVNHTAIQPVIHPAIKPPIHPTINQISINQSIVVCSIHSGMFEDVLPTVCDCHVLLCRSNCHVWYTCCVWPTFKSNYQG